MIAKGLMNLITKFNATTGLIDIRGKGEIPYGGKNKLFLEKHFLSKWILGSMKVGFENADDHLFLQSFAAKYGLHFPRPGNGICHQVHLERFSIPGQTLLGADSHTPTCGAMGTFALGVGGLDVALAMAGEPFYMKMPQVVRLRLLGQLSPWVSAKDIILHVLQRFTVKGGVGKVLEYGGPGIKALTVPERVTITNMGAELGATTSIFPSDEMPQSLS